MIRAMKNKSNAFVFKEKFKISRIFRGSTPTAIAVAWATALLNLKNAKVLSFLSCSPEMLSSIADSRD